MKIPESHILCIDDDANTADWVRIMLRGSKVNCHITTVDTGSEAFNLLNSQAFDLCILEYALPDMTGVQFCALMRNMGCDIPMMFFTAMNRPVDRAKAKSAGATEYLCKPDDLDVFVDAVSHLLKKRRNIYPAKTRFIDLAKAA